MIKNITDSYTATFDLSGNGPCAIAMSPGVEYSDNENRLDAALTPHAPESQSIPLLLLSDGVGPSGMGDTASELFIETVKSGFHVMEKSPHPRKIVDQLIDLFHDSHSRIKNFGVESGSSGKKAIMGASGLALTIVDHLIHYVWVGNIRAYLFAPNSDNKKRIFLEKVSAFRKIVSAFSSKPVRYRHFKGKPILTQLTEDHSYIYELYKQEKITRDELTVHPNKKFSTMILGISETVSPDAGYLHASPGDLILIASHGFHGVISDRELYEKINFFGKQLSLSGEHNKMILGDLARSLLNLARSKKGKDFISLILFYYTG